MNAVLSAQVSLLHVIESSDHSVSNHSLSLSKSGLVSFRDLPRDTALDRSHPHGLLRHLGFAST